MGLSSQGYLKASGIMQLDEILLHLSGQDKAESSMFGLRFYWLSFLGEPSADQPWGWQLDGHHLALNFSMAGREIAVTPTFMGSDPHEIRDGPNAGWRVLGAEDDRAGAHDLAGYGPTEEGPPHRGRTGGCHRRTGPDKALQRFEGYGVFRN